MKLKECNWCSLHKSRKRLSFSIGQKPASVFILFDREPLTPKGKENLQFLIRSLNYHLKYDYHYGFLIKCYTDKMIQPEHIKCCRRWLKNEIDKIQPYLVVMMGKYSTAACLGGKNAKLAQENVFYIKTLPNKVKRQYFCGCNIESASDSRIKQNIKYLENFIKEFYNAS